MTRKLSREIETLNLIELTFSHFNTTNIKEMEINLDMVKDNQ